MQLSRTIIACITVCYFVTSSPGQISSLETINSKMDSIDFTIDKMLSGHAKKIGNKSVMAGIITPYYEDIRSYGRVNFLGRKPDQNTVYEIGSITKTFTAYLVADAIENGDMNLSDELLDHLDGIKNERLQGVTIKKIVTHDADLPSETIQFISPSIIGWIPVSIIKTQFIYPSLQVPWYVSNIPWEAFIIPSLIPYGSVYGEKSLIRDLKKVRPRKAWSYDSSFHYSNLAMGTLGYVLSKKSNQPYEELITDKITSPLQMSDTKINLARSMKKRYATPHNWLGFRRTRFKMKTGALEGAGGIRSTTGDMIKYLKANLGLAGDQSLISILSSTHQKLFKPDNYERLDIGMAWLISKKENAPMQNEIIWHNGRTVGSASFIGFNKHSKTGVVLLSNNNNTRKLTKIGQKISLLLIEKSRLMTLANQLKS